MAVAEWLDICAHNLASQVSYTQIKVYRLRQL